MMTYLWTYVMKKKATITSYAVIGSLNIFSSSSGSGWPLYHLELVQSPHGMLFYRILQCIYWERSPGIWIQYNYDCDPSLYNFRFASSKINILFLGLCTLRVWVEKISECMSYKWNGIFAFSSPLWHQKSAFSIPHLMTCSTSNRAVWNTISLPALVQNTLTCLKQKNMLFQKIVYTLILLKGTFDMCFHYLPGFYRQMLSLELPKKWNFLLIRQRPDRAAGDCPPAIPDNFFLKETPHWCIPLHTSPPAWWCIFGLTAYSLLLLLLWSYFPLLFF